MAADQHVGLRIAGGSSRPECPCPLCGRDVFIGGSGLLAESGGAINDNERRSGHTAVSRGYRGGATLPQGCRDVAGKNLPAVLCNQPSGNLSGKPAGPCCCEFLSAPPGRVIPHAGLIDTMRDLTSRTGMRELTMRSLRHSAAFGEPGDAETPDLRRQHRKSQARVSPEVTSSQRVRGRGPGVNRPCREAKQRACR